MGGNKKGRGRDLLFYFKQEGKIRQPLRQRLAAHTGINTQQTKTKSKRGHF
jgi:hypothetical protein